MSRAVETAMWSLAAFLLATLAVQTALLAVMVLR